MHAVALGMSLKLQQDTVCAQILQATRPEISVLVLNEDRSSLTKSSVCAQISQAVRQEKLCACDKPG